MMRTATLSLVDGTKVVVPDSLNLITPYVLKEQADWFEDEIRFLRRLLRQGDQMIDVGANYGVYGLSMASKVGPPGRVWAFEPASGTAGMLADSVALNAFVNVVVDGRALSDAPGRARLSLNDNSELNAITRAGGPLGHFESVELTTLDACMDQYGWRDVRVVKIDAEGEESRILRGGARFFSELSPLVLYEIKAGEAWHLDVTDLFSQQGYRSYRLIPGLDMLAPFGPGEPPDGYLLNLFACKSDRAAELATQGWLVLPDDAGRDGPDLGGIDGEARWKQPLAGLPFAAELGRIVSADADPAMFEALALHARSQDRSVPAGVRLGAMRRSLGLLTTACGAKASPSRLSTLARVADGYGSRSLAVQALQLLFSAVERDAGWQLDGPFLPACERFDHIPPAGRPREWLLASALEAFETRASFSSYYTGPAARPRLELIERLGWASDEMTRRLALLRERFGS